MRLETKRILYVILGLMTVVILFVLVSHQSPNPFIMGRYSLPYFIFLVLSITLFLFIGVLFYRFKLKALYIVLANVVVLIVALVLIEVFAQVYFFLNPTYDVLFLQPDRVVGWKQVPNLQWVWAGHFWYANEFSVPIKTNSFGFRDLERGFQPAPNVVRVALLGDSFVEAVQVPFEKTGGYLLEQKLNDLNQSPSPASVQYEVLNFGISNHSVGQYLLVWEEYASKFGPDYVFLFVSNLQLKRTRVKDIPGGFVGTQYTLWIRPTFNVEGDTLVREPARDFEAFVKAQEDVIRTWSGKRIQRRRPELLIPYSLERIEEGLIDIQEELIATPRYPHYHLLASPMPIANNYDPQDLLVNEMVVLELGQQVNQAGGKLVVVDADSGVVSAEIQRFCADNGFAYVPLSDYLLEAKQQDIPTRWEYDAHFNETGNEIFAEAMYQWMVENVVEYSLRSEYK
jgi:lysophospholipase L1-like esterase